MNIAEQIKKAIFEAAGQIAPDVSMDGIQLEHPASEEHGDYSTNIAMQLVSLERGDLAKLGATPREVAEKISRTLQTLADIDRLCQKVEVAGPGFINFTLKEGVLIGDVGKIREMDKEYGINQALLGKKIMVEFAHPNTHKELHIGHMRTLTTGEALARIFAASGAEVFRANYQGDIGPHVAKAIWGVEKLLAEKKMDWTEAEKLSLKEKAHLLGQGYIRGNSDYEKAKSEIDELNKKLYTEDQTVWPVYERTRRWSLEYYDELYRRFGTKFDHLYFESEVAQPGKAIVEANVGKVFEKSEGAIIFDGEKYGLHKRVFVTKDGNPTYEAKDMALAPLQYADFPFDLVIHVVASEQAGYFQVIIKALELLDPNFVGREFHLSMGMVQLVGRKISSRTGELVTVDGLLDEVKNLLRPLVHSDLETSEKEKVLEAATIGAVKYSVLKSSPLLNSTFDLEKSVSLEGDSGPYLQYTYARARSVLRKSEDSENSEGQGARESDFQRVWKSDSPSVPSFLEQEEISILRWLYRFPEVVEMAARNYAPNLVCSYLFELAKRFNNFYNEVPIIQGNRGGKGYQGNEAFRLSLVEATSIVLKNGLKLLGIEALERM